MAVLYTYAKEQDKHYITNNEGTDLTYSITLLSDCVSYNEISSGTITPAEKKLMTLSLDGTYKITLTNQAVETADVDILKYLTLQTSLIQDVFDVLCGCECGCTPCSGFDVSDCQKILTTISKMESFIRLNAPLYDAYLAVIYAETNCLITPDIYCNLNTETITGSSIYNENLMKKLIALDYLAVYFWELDLETVQADIDFVKTKFMTTKILCCIKKLNIDITALKVKIDALP